MGIGCAGLRGLWERLPGRWVALRNPIVPAITILLWESINGILPAALQKLSVLYYVQSLCPVPAPTDRDAPLLIRLLLAPAEPPSATLAVLGLCGVTALVLWAASRAVRRWKSTMGSTERGGCGFCYGLVKSMKQPTMM